jgi:NAD(P)-dependent dehydrogenase (short-subunit alcohol dehydrogenase family)
VAVVTGAGRGIGRATAVALAREGAGVACVARTAAQLAETAALVGGAGRRAQRIVAGIGEPSAPSLIAAKVLAGLGAIGILVNNAATVEPAGPTAAAGPEGWARAGAVSAAVSFLRYQPWRAAAGYEPVHSIALLWRCALGRRLG